MTKASRLRPRLSPIYFAAGLALAAPLTAEAAPDPACDATSAAISKLLQTPNHQFMSQSSATDALTHGGKLRTSESISTGEAAFVRFNDKWRKVPFSAQDMLKQQEESRQNSQESCRFLRDDPAEGDASVYGVHTESNGGKSDVTIWISKSNGLPVREEIDLDLGGAVGKTHSSVRFDYEHVAAPADAK